MRLSKLFCALAASLVLFACTDAKTKAPAVNAPVVSAAGANATAAKCEYPTSPIDTSSFVAIHGNDESLPCRFGRRTLFTLDSASFDIDHKLANITRNSRGEYIVFGRGNVLGLLDASGKLIRTFGRDGSGPGEFRSATGLLVAANDTVYVIDGGQRRLTVIDPTFTKLIRTVSVPSLAGGENVLPVPQSQLLVGGQVFAGVQPDTSFNTLRIMSADGRIVRAWGIDTMSANESARNRRKGIRELVGKRGAVMARRLSAGVDGSVMVARANSYLVEQWSSDFHLTRTFARHVDWFPTLSVAGMRLNFVNDSTPAQIFGVAVDSASGNIVVQLIVASSRWKSPADVRTAGEGKTSSVKLDGDLTKYLDTIFESFDPRTGQLTASIRLPGFFASLSSGQQFWTRRELPDGDVAIDVVQLELSGHAKTSR